MKTALWDWSVLCRIIVPNHRTAKNRKWTRKIVGLAIFRNFRKICSSFATYIINKTNNCEKSQVSAKNRRPCDFCDFCDFSQAHEKSQISQLRANLDISVSFCLNCHPPCALRSASFALALWVSPESLMDCGCFLRVWLNHLHFLLIACLSTGSWPALPHSSSLVTLFYHLIFRMFHRDLLMNVWSLSVLWCW